MKRKILSAIIIALILLSGCCNDNVPDSSLPQSNTKDYPALLSVTWYKESYADSMYVELFKLAFSQSDYYDNNEMQKVINRIDVQYPIDSPSEIEMYAWELYSSCTKMGMLDEEMIPCRAFRFSDQIWVVSFAAIDTNLSYYDGPAATLLFSDVDGHVIYFTADELHYP